MRRNQITALVLIGSAMCAALATAPANADTTTPASTRAYQAPADYNVNGNEFWPTNDISTLVSDSC